MECTEKKKRTVREEMARSPQFPATQVSTIGVCWARPGGLGGGRLQWDLDARLRKRDFALQSGDGKPPALKPGHGI